METQEEREEELLEQEEGEEVDIEVAYLFATPPAAASPPLYRASERPRRPTLRRSRRPTSEGGSPLNLGLPYSGRPFCEYN